MNQLSPYQLADTDVVVAHGPHVYHIPRMRDLPTEEKPREKLMAHGPAALGVRELLEVVLGQGTKKEDVRTLASRLVCEYGSRTLAHESSVQRLRDELGVPEAKACQIVACFELGRRYFDTAHTTLTTLRTPEQVFEYAKDMARLQKEHLRGLYLNNHYQVIHDEVLSIGSLTAHIVHPREVFRPALAYGASALILVHNHPSGVAEPSQADKTVTTRLQTAGDMLGIELLDHVIVGHDSFTSVMNQA